MISSIATELVATLSAFAQLAIAKLGFPGYAALLLTIAALLASLLFIIGILGDRFLMKRRREREALLLPEWRARLLAVISGETVEPVVPSSADAPAVLALWMRMLGNVDGSASERMIAFGVNCCFREAATQLDRPNTRQRLLALAVLAEIADPADLPRFQRGLYSQRVRVSVTAATGLLRADAEHGLPILLAYYGEGHRHPMRDVRGLLAGLPDDLFSDCFRREARQHESLPLPLEKLLGWLPAGEARTHIARGLDDPDPERQANALRLVEDPRLLAGVLRAANSEEWFVRANAVIALGRIGSREQSALLRERMDDASWWVRYRAAEALAKIDPTVDPDSHEMLALLRQERG